MNVWSQKGKRSQRFKGSNKEQSVAYDEEFRCCQTKLVVYIAWNDFPQNQTHAHLQMPQIDFQTPIIPTTNKQPKILYLLSKPSTDE